jgi:hypothetical protein
LTRRALNHSRRRIAEGEGARRAGHLDRQEPELPMLRLLPKKEEKIVH